MPLTEKGQEILSNMREEYGAERGEQVFYASANSGAITGVDQFTGFPERAFPNFDPYTLVEIIYE